MSSTRVISDEVIGDVRYMTEENTYELELRPSELVSGLVANVTEWLKFQASTRLGIGGFSLSEEKISALRSGLQARVDKLSHKTDDIIATINATGTSDFRGTTRRRTSGDFLIRYDIKAGDDSVTVRVKIGLHARDLNPVPGIRVNGDDGPDKGGEEQAATETTEVETGKDVKPDA